MEEVADHQRAEGTAIQGEPGGEGELGRQVNEVSMSPISRASLWESVCGTRACVRSLSVQIPGQYPMPCPPQGPHPKRPTN